MKYAEYMLYLNHAELDIGAYKALLNDGITANELRLSSILDAFMSLNVPENYSGDVDEIYRDGLLDIQNGHYAQDIIGYADLIWALPTTVADATFHVLEQLVTPVLPTALSTLLE